MTVSRIAPKLSRAPVSVVRFSRPTINRTVSRPAIVNPRVAPPNFLPDPYVDYARLLTPEGGIAIVYKDLDQRWRHTLLRLFMWASVTAGEAWIIFKHLPPLDTRVAIACLVVVAILNWLIVAKPVEIHRSIEIRPDCMILEGSDVFWIQNMEGGVPMFREDADGNQILCGIYGNRFIEYLTVRRFDELDRTPEILAWHLQDAMQRLWSWNNQL